MGLLLQRQAILRPRAGGAIYNQIPLKMLKAIPAGFPLPLHGDMFDNANHLQAIFGAIQSGGEDLRAFSNEAMTVEVPIEIVSITTGSDIIFAYILIGSAMSINDKIWLRTTIGGGETAYAVTDTFGRNAVWAAYECVVHGSAMNVDATGNNADGSNVGGVALSGVDLLNGWPARGFGVSEGGATTDRSNIVTPTMAEVCDEMAVFLKDGTEGHNQGRAVQWQGLDTQLKKVATDELEWRRKTSSAQQSINSTGNRLTDNVWHGFSATWVAIGSAPTFRHSGAAFTGTIANGTGTFTAPSQDLFFGNNPGGTIELDGRIAEYRNRPDNVPDAPWKDLEWDGFNDPGSIAEAEAMVTV